MLFHRNDPKTPPRHERRVLVYALLAGLPAVALSTTLLFASEYSDKTRWTLLILVAAAWLGFSLAVRQQVVFPLRTLSNLLAALREGYSAASIELRRASAMRQSSASYPAVALWVPVLAPPPDFTVGPRAMPSLLVKQRCRC